MLERLEQLAVSDGRVKGALAANDIKRLLDAVERALLSKPEIFAGAVAQLTSDDVQGCTPEQNRAEAARAHGNALFQEGQYHTAVELYTEALQYQSALTPGGQVAASRLYSNRAAALLRLMATTTGGSSSSSSAPSRIPPARGSSTSSAPTSSTPSTTSPVAVSCSGLPPQSARSIARAALEDAHCATRADPTFVKAYYRAACAQRALGDLPGAIEECHKALEAGSRGEAAAASGTGLGRRAGGQDAPPCQTGGGGGGGAAASPVQVDEAAALLAELQFEMGRTHKACGLEGEAKGEEGKSAVLRTGGVSNSAGTCGSIAVHAVGIKEGAGNGRDERERVRQLPPTSATDPRLVAGSTPDHGRHLIVSHKSSALPPAADVLYDWPLAAMLCKRWRRRGGAGGGGGGTAAAVPPRTMLRCWRCTAALQAETGAVPYPCAYCPMALYCSPYCRDHDLFHVPGGCECGLPWSHLLPEEALLSCRLVRRAAAEQQQQLLEGPRLAAAVAEALREPDALAAAAAAPPEGPPAGLAKLPSAAVATALPSSSSSSGGAALWDPHLTRGSLSTQEVLDGLLTHCDSLDSAALVRTAVLAAVAAAAYRSACHVALRRWQKQRLMPERLPVDAQRRKQTQERQQQHQVKEEVKDGGLNPGRTLLPVLEGEEDEKMRHEREEEEAREVKRLQQLRRLSGAVPVAGLQPPEVSALAVFLTLCRVRVNGVAVRPDVMTSSGDRLALALYPDAALLNHSCFPNVGLRFHGLQLVARTIRPVPPGQPLTISYGPQRGKVPRRERLTALEAQYAFTCQCEACAVSDPWAADDVAALEAALWGLKCPTCSSQAGDQEPQGGQALDAREDGAGRHDRRKFPAAVLPTDPRVIALCGGGAQGQLGVERATGRHNKAAKGECTRCGRRLTEVEVVAAAEVMAAAEVLAAQVAAALGEEGEDDSGGTSGGAQGNPLARQPAALLLAAWQKLQHAAEQRRQVLPDTNRLMGCMMRQLASLAARTLRAAAEEEAAEAEVKRKRGHGAGPGTQMKNNAAATAAAAAPPPPVSSGARRRPSKDELRGLAYDAVRYASYSLLALQQVYGSCSTEVLYELELLVDLLREAPPPPPPPPLTRVQSPDTASVAVAAQPPHPASAVLFGGEHCGSCGLTGGAHDAALHSRLSDLLAAALHCSRRDEQPVAHCRPFPGHLAAAPTFAAASSPATSRKDIGGAAASGGGGDSGGGDAGGREQAELERMLGAAHALYRCLRWHLLGEELRSTPVAFR
ncbi:hypothetical protein Vafri_13594 [Volvox africanus]|nr:hypothetical protein Vafri_13594 [Volvox africanus]